MSAHISVGQTTGGESKNGGIKKLILVGGAMPIFGHEINFLIHFGTPSLSNGQGTSMPVSGTLPFSINKPGNNRSTHH